MPGLGQPASPRRRRQPYLAVDDHPAAHQIRGSRIEPITTSHGIRSAQPRRGEPTSSRCLGTQTSTGTPAETATARASVAVLLSMTPYYWYDAWADRYAEWSTGVTADVPLYVELARHC